MPFLLRSAFVVQSTYNGIWMARGGSLSIASEITKLRVINMME
jgi:hypothetical protein